MTFVLQKFLAIFPEVAESKHLKTAANFIVGLKKK